MKIITVIGARPQFIKEAAFSIALQKHPQIKRVVVHTGQHFDQNMSEIFFDTLGLPKPDYVLSCGGLTQGEMTGVAITEIEKILLKERPDACVVYGDTNATLAGALAAVKLRIPVMHIEAGLRSFDFKMPEEINRVLTDSISTVLCCPSERAVEGLKAEGFPRYDWQKIICTGDIQFDSTKLFSDLEPSSQETKDIVKEKKSYLLVTMHRPSNVDDLETLKMKIQQLQELSGRYKVVFPIHPRTRARVEAGGVSLEGLHVMEPVGYIDMLYLVKHSVGVVTDSGGLQKEAFYLGKRTVVLRDTTEWVELVEIGVSLLEKRPLSIDAICSHIELGDIATDNASVYGFGDTAERCIQALLDL